MIQPSCMLTLSRVPAPRAASISGRPLAAKAPAPDLTNCRRVRSRFFMIAAPLAPRRPHAANPFGQGNDFTTLLGSAKIRDRRCLFGITPTPVHAVVLHYLDQVARVGSIRRAAEK